MLYGYMNEKHVKYAWIFQKLHLKLPISDVSPANKDRKIVKEIVRVDLFLLFSY